ncbi:MAG: CDP-alcohol phosphatidyltransferase family protein [Dehalococcoidia bacterium]
MMSPPGSRPFLNAKALRAQAKEALLERFAEPAARLLSQTGLTPNKVSVIGGALSLAAGHTISRGHLFTGGVLVLAAGAMDVLDGALARATGKKTRFGAVLDSTLDRVSEAAVLFGLLVLYTGAGSTPLVLLVYGTLVGSLLVSYIRARAEGLDITCDVGILTRAERTIIMALGLLLGKVPPALVTLALFSYITAAQRLLQVRRATAGDP